ncbi:MAG: hypothetical protein WBJ37_02070 [Bacteroidales bacterium]
MELFRKIRLKRGMWLLRKRAGEIKRNKFKGNLADVKSIGIVWDATRTSDFQFLAQFHQKMQEKGVDVKIIGYYPDKILPDRITAIRYLSCLKKNDLNYFYLPTSEEAENFIKTRFDVLIDVNFNDLLPLQYITAMSVASLKIGLFNDGNNSYLFDMMIDLNKNPKISDYFDHILHYLEMINNPAYIKK